MSNKHTYQVTAPDGSIHARTTARTYSHVVLAKHCEKTAREWAKWTIAPKSVERKNFAYYQAIVDGSHAHSRTTSEQKQAQYADLIARHETAENYVQALYADAVRTIDAQVKDGYFDEYHAIAWCGRRDLAEKQVASNASRGWTGFVIQEV